MIVRFIISRRQMELNDKKVIFFGNSWRRFQFVLEWEFQKGGGGRDWGGGGKEWKVVIICLRDFKGLVEKF